MKVVEDGIEVDLTNADHVYPKHDAKVVDGGEGNTVFGGVDRRFIAAGRCYWLELSLYRDRPHPKKEGQLLPSLISNGELRRELHRKFFRTAAYLGLTKQLDDLPITYVALVEPPVDLDAALRGALLGELSSLLPRKPKNRPWPHDHKAVVLDLKAWNENFPQFPASLTP